MFLKGKKIYFVSNWFNVYFYYFGKFLQISLNNSKKNAVRVVTGWFNARSCILIIILRNWFYVHFGDCKPSKP
jgi:hypothetical protein